MGTEGRMCDPVINWWSALIKDENYFDTVDYRKKLDRWAKGECVTEIMYEVMWEDFCFNEINPVF